MDDPLKVKRLNTIHSKDAKNRKSKCKRMMRKLKELSGESLGGTPWDINPISTGGGMFFHPPMVNLMPFFCG